MFNFSCILHINISYYVEGEKVGIIIFGYWIEKVFADEKCNKTIKPILHLQIL